VNIGNVILGGLLAFAGAGAFRHSLKELLSKPERPTAGDITQIAISCGFWFFVGILLVFRHEPLYF